MLTGLALCLIALAIIASVFVLPVVMIKSIIITHDAIKDAVNTRKKGNDK